MLQAREAKEAVMMLRRVLPTLILLGMGFGLGILWSSGALTPRAMAQAAKDAPAAAAPSPVVACTPYLSVTEYEQDPFNEDRVQRTRTTVNNIILVHADGTTETKRVSN
jgi:hypothetical protein